MTGNRRNLWFLPLAFALVGLAVPMIGSGFIGWPFVLAWLGLILLVWWVRPLGGADRTARLAAGVLIVAALILLGTFGGWYLIPAVVVWMVLVATTPAAMPGGPPMSSSEPDLT